MEKAIENTKPDILEAILAELRKTRSRDDDFWTAEEIADCLKLKKSTVQSHILDQANFPEPIELPTGGRRWIAKEVRAWVLRRR